MMDKNQAQQQLESLVRDLYQALSDGLDVSPARRLRLEGRIELMLELQLIEQRWLEQTITVLYQQYFGRALAQGYWQWLADEQMFCLPFKMQDAPVYKN